MATQVGTGLQGKGWGRNLLNNRISYLAKTMLNGGAHKSFPQLKAAAEKQFPGGKGLNIKHVYRVRRALDQGKRSIQKVEDLDGVRMPTRLEPWLEMQRGQQEKRFQKLQEKSKTLGEPDVKFDDISQPHTDKEELKISIGQLKEIMKRQGVVRLEVTLLDDGKLNVKGTTKPMTFQDTV